MANQNPLPALVQPAPPLPLSSISSLREGDTLRHGVKGTLSHHLEKLDLLDFYTSVESTVEGRG